jgi:hypothetical protein
VLILFDIFTDTKGLPMTNEEKTNDNPTTSQRDYDQEAAIDSLMDQIQPGFRLTVYRVSPAWCDGYLEEYEIDPNTPIDLAYLASTWGGDVLRIKLRDQKGKTHDMVIMTANMKEFWNELEHFYSDADWRRHR